jgi:hypothetical protein
VGVSLIAGVALIIKRLAVAQHERSSSFPMVPFLLIFFSFAAVLSLSIIRGFAFWSGDTLSHVGTIYNIINTSHIESQNFYPIVHILVAQYFEICNIPVLNLAVLFPLIFALLSVPFTYIFARTILPEHGHIILASIFSMTFMGGFFIMITPNCLANLAFPLALFLLVKYFTSVHLQWKILFIIIVFLFPVFHPLPGFILMVVLLTIPLARRIYINRKSNISPPSQNTAFRFNKGIVITYFVWATFWISLFNVFSTQVENTYLQVTKGGQNSIGVLVGQINYAAGYNYNVSEMFFKTYGGLFILTLLTIIASVILWKKRPASCLLLASFTGPLLVITVILVVLFVGNFGFGPTRLLQYIVTLGSLFTAFILFEIIKPNITSFSRLKNMAMPCGVTILILTLFILGGLKLYPSRYILVANPQVTKTDIDGMDWFLNKIDNAGNITTISIAVYRFADLLLTPQEQDERPYYLDRSNYYFKEYQLPYHFGYEQTLRLGDYYDQDLYLPLDSQDRKLYRDVYPEISTIRFELQDFMQLESDTSVDKLYSNGGLDTFYIHGLAPARTK